MDRDKPLTSVELQSSGERLSLTFCKMACSQRVQEIEHGGTALGYFFKAGAFESGWKAAGFA